MFACSRLSSAAVLLVLAAGCGFVPGAGTSVNRQNGVLVVSINGTSEVVGSGKVGTAERAVAGFERVSARQAVEVAVSITDKESATVEADDNLLPLIETTVQNGTLVVGIKGSLKTKNPIRVRVTAKQLVGLSADSSGQISGQELKSERLELTASSGGQVTVQKLEVKQIKANVSSGASVVADGKSERQHVDVSSAGRYDGGKLECQTAKVDASSGASATVHATEEVSGSASSGGNVRYVGKPTKVNVATSSGGSAQATGK